MSKKKMKKQTGIQSVPLFKAEEITPLFEAGEMLNIKIGVPKKNTDELARMIIRYACKNGMTISNIYESLRIVKEYMRNNAVLEKGEDLTWEEFIMKLEDEKTSRQEREELLKHLPAGARQLFSGKPIKEPSFLKHYQKRGN